MVIIIKNNHFKVKENCLRKNCKDVFKTFLVKNANYVGIFDLPKISSINDVPQKIMRFSKCISCKDYDYWIHFYEDDYQFERLWNNPKKYLELLKKYKGIILPDFSLYRDMPLSMQIWNIYRSRAIGFWLQNNGIKVIPNIRFGDDRTFELCCDGIEKRSIIAIGSYGCYKNIIDRDIFIRGFNKIIDILNPSIVIVYGKLPKEIEYNLKNNTIKIIVFKPFEFLEGN